MNGHGGLRRFSLARAYHSVDDGACYIHRPLGKSMARLASGRQPDWHDTMLQAPEPLPNQEANQPGPHQERRMRIASRDKKRSDRKKVWVCFR